MSVRLSWDPDDLVEAYQDHQDRTRRLRDRTAGDCEPHVRAFARDALGEYPVVPGRLTTADEFAVVGSMRVTCSPASIKAVGTFLRPFLRHLRPRLNRM